MVTELNYRGLNLFGTSSIMRDLVRRAILHIRRGRFKFKVYEKMGADGSADVVTDIDKSAQQIYTDMLWAVFPEYGIIAEENDFRIESTDLHDLYFSIDAIDDM